jgi:hypothetical protein
MRIAIHKHVYMKISVMQISDLAQFNLFRSGGQSKGIRALGPPGYPEVARLSFLRPIAGDQNFDGSYT